jgi:DNA-directed RNA polymerase subunit RPC12/RpoP
MSAIRDSLDVTILTEYRCSNCGETAEFHASDSDYRNVQEYRERCPSCRWITNWVRSDCIEKSDK